MYQAWTRRLLTPDMNKDWCSFPDIRRSTHRTNNLVRNDLLILKKLATENRKGFLVQNSTFLENTNCLFWTYS